MPPVAAGSISWGPATTESGGSACGRFNSTANTAHLAHKIGARACCADLLLYDPARKLVAQSDMKSLRRIIDDRTRCRVCQPTFLLLSNGCEIIWCRTKVPPNMLLLVCLEPWNNASREKPINWTYWITLSRQFIYIYTTMLLTRKENRLRAKALDRANFQAALRSAADFFLRASYPPQFGPYGKIPISPRTLEGNYLMVPQTTIGYIYLAPWT